MITLANNVLTDDEIKDKLKEIFTHYGGKSDDLIALLQETQEKFRYLPGVAMQEIARFLHVPISTVYGVSTFYAQFKLTPSGRRIVRVCRGTACHVRGSVKVQEEVEKVLGIKAGGTTPDMEYSLETIACIGACALAPTMTVDEETYGKMTTKKVAEVFGDGRKAA